MKYYKQKTIALVLASVMTVVGSFAASNYKNSVMSLKFEANPSGAVNMTIFTKTNYENNITPVKKDANTYVIMLPETNSQMSEQPALNGNVESIDVRTMPYTNTAKGYTKITIKTPSNTLLKAQNELYIPEIKKDKENSSALNNNVTTPIQQQSSEKVQNIDNIEKNKISEQNSLVNSSENITTNSNNVQVNNTSPLEAVSDNNQADEISNEKISDNSSNNSYELLYLILGVLSIITFVAYLVIKSSNKMNEILGEQTKFDVEENDKQINKQEEEKPKNKIKKSIEKLDKMYAKPVTMPIREIINNSTQQEKEVKEDLNILDLDEIFQEQTKNIKDESENSEENDILNDFLTEFFGEENKSIQASEDIHKNEETDKYIDELFNKIKNNSSVKITPTDIDNINMLLNVEISDDFINEFRGVFEKENNAANKKKSLNNMVADLLSIQNISFTQDDVSAIDKIMNVELDGDFVTNLHTNPIQIQNMESNILKTVEKKHNTKEILILHVEDSLPDLSKELAKTKKIESNAKPETVFFEEGYDVDILHSDLPDLSKEIKKHKKSEYVPSVDEVLVNDDWEMNDNGIDILKVSQELPDLADVKANPKKYEDKKSKPRASEKKLLKNLNSIAFKPLYDGNEQNEILNDNLNDNLLEMNLNDELTEYLPLEEELVEYDLEHQSEQNKQLVNEVGLELSAKTVTVKNRRKKDPQTENLLNLIDKKQEKGINKNRVSLISEKKTEKNDGQTKPAENIPKKVTVDGVDYSILAVTRFTDNIGCYLATSIEEGYSILGYAGDDIFKVKHFEKVKNSNLQSRVSERFDDGTLRYIVRIGIHKFVLDVSDENMEYVMDLC